MHVFRVTLKGRDEKGAFSYVDLPTSPETSLVVFSQAVKAGGGVCNEAVAIPYENILYVARMDVTEPTGIYSPARGSRDH
ncbi:MAG: hypothetical protein RLZZ373_2734 [Pseudomonadota bacterium]